MFPQQPLDIAKSTDVDFHLQAASRAFHANRCILTDRHVSLATGPRYFDTVITPVACFAAGHRAICKNDLNNTDVVFRKLLRSVVGPPAATDWSRPWHEILHDWNARVTQFVQQYSVKRWSVLCFRNALEISAICCQPTSRPLVVPHSDMDAQGASHC